MIEFQTVWGWQPALYLFLGGMGAGALVLAGILTLIDRKSNNTTICIAQWSAAACMAVGLLLLLSELTNPMRGVMAWESFVNPASWMTWGAWGVLAAIVIAVIAALCTMRTTAAGIAALFKSFKKARPTVCKALAVIGIIFGLFVAVYTGILLMSAPGIPFWNTPLLPLLFTISGLDTGAALVEIIALVVRKRERMTERCSELLEKAIIVMVVLEAVVLAAFLLTAGGEGAAGEAAAASVAAITAGSLAPWFWCLVVLCGLAAPLAASLLALKAKKGSDTGIIVLSGALGALIGGCALRFLVVMAGVHADLVAETVMSILL